MKKSFNMERKQYLVLVSSHLKRYGTSMFMEGKSDSWSNIKKNPFQVMTLYFTNRSNNKKATRNNKEYRDVNTSWKYIKWVNCEQ